MSENSSDPSLSKEELEKATESLRELFAKEATDNSDHYCQSDVSRIAEDDHYCHRFIWHQNHNVKKAFNMVKEALKWRKEFGVNDIKESNVDLSLFEEKSVYPYGKDKEGNENLVMIVKLFRTDAEYQKKFRRLVVYWFEVLEKRSNQKQINMLSDCTSAGLSNADLGFSRFMTNMITIYYPHFMNRMLVIDMPWILNAIWKIVKSWLPKAYADKTIFLDLTGLLEYVEPNCLPLFLGGTNTEEYEYVPSKN